METEEEAPSKEEEEKESSSAHDRNRRTAIERLRVGGRAERKTGRRVVVVVVAGYAAPGTNPDGVMGLRGLLFPPGFYIPFSFHSIP